LIGYKKPSQVKAIWHFLSDADIRFKDPRYAVMQLEGLRLALAKWEHEIAA